MSLLRKEREAQMRKLRKKGATYQEIANTFKMSRQRAHQILNPRISTGTDIVLDKDLTGE